MRCHLNCYCLFLKLDRCKITTGGLFAPLNTLKLALLSILLSDTSLYAAILFGFDYSTSTIVNDITFSYLSNDAE